MKQSAKSFSIDAAVLCYEGNFLKASSTVFLLHIKFKQTFWCLIGKIFLLQNVIPLISEGYETHIFSAVGRVKGCQVGHRPKLRVGAFLTSKK